MHLLPQSAEFVGNLSEVQSRRGGAEPSGAGATAMHLLPQSAEFVGNVSEVQSRRGGAEPSGACRSGFNPTKPSRAEARPTGNVSEVRFFARQSRAKREQLRKCRAVRRMRQNSRC